MTVGLIGYGVQGKRLYQLLQALHVKVLVCDPLAHPSFLALEAVGPQAERFIVATPNHTHVAIATQLAPFRRPILIEKPGGTSARDCARLGRLAVPVVVNYNERLQRVGDAPTGGLIGVREAERKSGDVAMRLMGHDLSLLLDVRSRVTPYETGTFSQGTWWRGTSRQGPIYLEAREGVTHPLRRWTILGQSVWRYDFMKTPSLTAALKQFLSSSKGTAIEEAVKIHEWLAFKKPSTYRSSAYR